MGEKGSFFESGEFVLNSEGSRGGRENEGVDPAGPGLYLGNSDPPIGLQYPVHKGHQREERGE